MGCLSSWALIDVAVAAFAMGTATALWLSVFSAFLFIGLSVALEISYSWNEIKSVLPTAIVRIGGIGFGYASLSTLPVGVVVSIMGASSLIAICVFAPLRGESVSRKTIGYGLLSFVGIFLVTRISLTESIFVFDLKLLLPLAATFCGAYSLVLWRDTSAKLPTLKNLTILHTWSAVLLIPVVLMISAITSQAIRPNGNTFALFIIVGVAAIGDSLFVKAQKDLSLTLNGVLMPTKIILSTVFAIIFLGQTLAWWQMIGALIIVFSVGASTYSNQRITYEKHVTFLPVRPASEVEEDIDTANLAVS